MYSIIIDTKTQALHLYMQDNLEKSYTVSTAKNGTGHQYGSEQTPLGKHFIRAKIGANAASNAVFVARRLTGEIHTPELHLQHPGRDWMLTRILWLCGREPGKNRFGNVDSAKRKIYIHGSPSHSKLGTPSSHGCVKMYNHDIIELFDMIPAGTPVNII